jgi:ABC-2 type transport system permease protein
VSDARILDQGYRPYVGARRGPAGAVRSLAWHSTLRALGLRRTFWAKLLPIASITIAYLPAAVFVGVAALLPGELENEVLPEYAEYYGFISAAIILFVAAVGPEVLCPDRRTGVLGLYLASPLTRDTYLLAKVIAVLPVLAMVTLGPPLLLLVGLTLADAGPDGLGEFLLLLLRVVASGMAVAAAYTALSLAAASLTERRAVASGGIILFLLTISTATSALVEGADADVRLYLLNLFLVPFELTTRIYGDAGAEPRLSTASLVAADLAWVLAAGFLTRWRYQRLRVTR